MKILIDLGKYKPTSNSIIIYDKEKERWVITTRHEFLANEDKVILMQSQKIAELEKEIKEFKQDITQKVNTIAKAVKTILGE
jgi:N-acetylneuraminic acid mutarotase